MKAKAVANWYKCVIILFILLEGYKLVILNHKHPLIWVDCFIQIGLVYWKSQINLLYQYKKYLVKSN